MDENVFNQIKLIIYAKKLFTQMFIFKTYIIIQHDETDYNYQLIWLFEMTKAIETNN